MKIALMDVDSHNFPNLALMKLSAWRKAQGDIVEWWDGFGRYDRLYMSKVFTEEYSPDELEPVNAAEIIKGGTGYGLDNALPGEVEHMYPDYGLYPELTKDIAYGFLTRGCPRDCPFCIVSKKEGRHSRKVADLSEFWRGQKAIKLLDPNLLACPEHIEILEQLAASGAAVDFTQGLDIRLTTPENITMLRKVKIEKIHFAWDNPREDLTPQFRRYAELGKVNKHRKPGVYVLTNFNTSLKEDLYRIYTLRGLGYDPYVMIYGKPTSPKIIRDLQRWCNSSRIIGSEPDFAKYRRRIT